MLFIGHALDPMNQRDPRLPVQPYLNAPEIAERPVLARWLTGRRLSLLLFIAAALLSVPSLWAGWESDDHCFRLVFSHPEAAAVIGLHNSASATGLFTFSNGRWEDNQRLIDMGLAPWWMYPGARSSFLRPVTFLTHWLDYRLWPDRPQLMHLQSVAWYAVLVLTVAWFYRSHMGAIWVAGLAGLLYAIDDAHGTPIGWLANRNALLTTLFGVLALIAHHGWRSQAARGGWIMALVCLILSLLSNEAGVATIAYLVAYALFLDRAAWSSRLRGLAPYFVVVLVWRVLWWQGGFGSTGLGLYVDPGSQPLEFLAAMVYRAPLLLLGQWGVPPADLSMFLGRTGGVGHWLAAIVFLLVMIVVFLPLLRRDVLSRYFALGMVLALIPSCTTFPSDRIRMFVGVGAMGLLSRFFQEMMVPHPEWPRSRAWRMTARSTCVFLVIVHLIVAPLVLPVRTAMPLGPPWVTKQLDVRTPLDASVRDQTVVLVNGPSAFYVGYLPIRRALDGLPPPRHTRILSPSGAAVTLTRRDARTLVVRPADGYLAMPFDQLYRARKHSFALGERVELTGMSAEVTALTADGRPAEAVFHFSVELEDPSLRWLQWVDGDFVPFTPPEISGIVRLAPAMPSLRPNW